MLEFRIYVPGEFEVFEDGVKIGWVVEVDNRNGWYAMNIAGQSFCSAAAPNGDPSREDAVESMRKGIRAPN